jgi:predicted  nucleic acid-binding Zn-ribbon protein
MPHQCTECGHTFPDGSKDMLSGCPDCGGNKFQYFAGEVPEDPPDAEPPSPDEYGVSGRVGKAARTVREFVEGDDEESAGAPPSTGDGTTRPPSRQSAPSDERVTAEADVDDTGTASDTEETVTDGPTAPPEDTAQTSARSEVVDQETLPDEVDGEVVDTPSGERPDMSTLREELNDQFESIRIVDKGQYELNLMELYDREEYIIALQENGRYVIEVPESWRNPEE